MTEMRRGQKGGYDSSTLRLQIMSHNFDYVISIDAMGGKPTDACAASLEAFWRRRPLNLDSCRGRCYRSG